MHNFRSSECLLTRREGYPSINTFPLFFLRRVYKAARVTRVCELPCLRATVALVGRSPFSLVNAYISSFLLRRVYKYQGMRVTLSACYGYPGRQVTVFPCKRLPGLTF